MILRDNPLHGTFSGILFVPIACRIYTSLSLSLLHFLANSPICDRNCSTQISAPTNRIVPRHFGKKRLDDARNWYSGSDWSELKWGRRTRPREPYARYSPLPFCARCDKPAVRWEPLPCTDTADRRTANFCSACLPDRCDVIVC